MRKITIAFFMLFATSVFAQDGILDPSFGTNGYVLVNTAGGASFGNFVQPDGKMIYIQGNKFRRLNANGTADTGFGVSGEITITQPGALYQGFVVYNNQITFVSRSSGESYRMGRYNFDGTVDATLGVGGVGYVSINNGVIRGGAIPKLSVDHKLLLGGNSEVVFGSYNNYFVRNTIPMVLLMAPLIVQRPILASTLRKIRMVLHPMNSIRIWTSCLTEG